MSIRAVFVLKTGASSWSNESGKHGPSTSRSFPSTRTGAPPMSPSLRATSHVSGVPPSRCAPDDDRVDARAEVVDVRDRDDADSHARGARRASPTVATAWKRSPWPGAYSEGRPTRSRNSSPDASSRSETNWWKTSGSPSSRSTTWARTASSVAKLVISATGTVQSRARSSAAGLEELGLEEAHAVDGGQHGLDDAAEPRGHAAREDDLRDLPARQGSMPAALASS